jgi:hypothetical protein
MKVGDRVEIHPATSYWLQGDRYGTVIKVGRKRLHVRMDKSGRVLRPLLTGVLFTLV